jgi:hypothetical protein
MIMKKLLCTLTLILFTFSVFGQTLTREDYLLKSKRQKTIGHVLFTGGALMFTAGAIILFGDPGNEASVPLMGFGLLTDLASVPFYISSGINARKSAKLSLTYQHLSIPQNNGQAFNRMPMLTVRIPLN